MSVRWPVRVRVRLRPDSARRLHLAPPGIPARHAAPPSLPRRVRRDRSRGQALVELALVTPILLLLLLSAVDLGRLFYARITVANSAREGAMMAAEAPGSFSAGAACSAANKVICAATRESTDGWVTVAPADVALSCNPSCTQAYGNTVTVTVTGHFTVLTPVIWAFTGGQQVTFSESATADVVIRPAAAGVPATPTPTPVPTPTPTPDPSSSAAPTPSASPSPTPSPTPACPALVGFNTSQQNKNRPVVFTSTSTPTSGACAISYWRWEYGDGTTDAGTLSSASHTYADPKGRTFNVTLTVTTPSGTYSYTRAVTTKS